MENPNIDQVILSFLQGEATTNEIEMLRKWMNESHAHKAIFESVKSYWESSHLQVESIDIENAYSKFKARSNGNPAEKGVKTHAHRQGKHEILRAYKFNWSKIAAVFIAFLTFGGLLYFMNNSMKRVQQIELVQEMVKENPKGQKLTTYLPDGSKVILNSQSKITYKTSYANDERLVQLEGEAFFEVRKNPLKPFRVIANGVSTTALGTSFNVNTKNNRIEVALVTGQVKVEKGMDQFVILSPGKSAVMDFEGFFKVEKFNYLDKVGWKDGTLVFNDDSLSEIIEKLEDWYGVRFIASNEFINNFHYSGNYKNETLEDVLNGISFVHNFEFKIVEDTVEIFTDNKNQMPM